MGRHVAHETIYRGRKISPYKVDNGPLHEFFQQLNVYANRAQYTVDLLPEHEWDIKIDYMGYIDLHAKDIASARAALLKANWTNSNKSCFFFQGEYMVWLVPC